jgi:hypothetical protein
MMGGKRGYARAILGVLGLRQGLGASEVWLNDAGPWGPVWRVLTTPGKAEEVAAIIRGWKDEEPRALWDRLKAEGWGELTEVGEVAAWAAVQGGAFGGYDVTVKPPTPDHNRRPGGVHPGTWPQDITSRVEAVARWLVCGAWSVHGMDYSGPGARVREGNEGSCGALTVPGLASRLSSWPVPCRVFHGSALDVPIPDDCDGVFVYCDPPYLDTTGYQHDLPREDVIRVALAWSEAGATVCVSEAVPIEIPGWHHVEITSERVGQKRTFGGTHEWLTLNREPLWRPSYQPSLFGFDTAPDTGRAR